MPTRSTNDVLTDADRIVDTWTSNPDFKLGTITLTMFTEARDALASADAEVEKTRTELAALLNKRDGSLAALNELVTRARAGFKAVYGPDSTQYEQAGGTRRSERASSSRKAKPPEKS
ncbi:hypothetical protein [Oleiharenicola sp. Vm1]|uniref:hypothetical protein n=1 Tax=Oleiharenicola sp. Vm1 TaxID=3398393 RepID=UPI0039F54F61